MALRLAGEESAVQGLDNLGFLREIEASDADPGLVVDQKGAGDILSLRDNGVERLRLTDGGNVLLANVASPPASPDGLLHLWAGSAGAVAAQNAGSYLVIESDDAGGFGQNINFLGLATSRQRIIFGDVTDPDAGVLQYNHNSGRFEFTIEAVTRLFWSPGAFAFQEATTISTTAGDLTLDPAASVRMNKTLLLATNGLQVTTGNADGRNVQFHARDNGVGLVEIARMQGAADPYWQMTTAMRLNPVAQPGTLVEGHFWYDSTAKKLKFYNGTAVETVTST